MLIADIFHKADEIEYNEITCSSALHVLIYFRYIEYDKSTLKQR